jgi:hypothetical protein
MTYNSRIFGKHITLHTKDKLNNRRGLIVATYLDGRRMPYYIYVEGYGEMRVNRNEFTMGWKI